MHHSGKLYLLFLLITACNNSSDKQPAPTSTETAINQETPAFPSKDELLGTWTSAEQFDQEEMSRAGDSKDTAAYGITALVNDTTRYEANGYFSSHGIMKMDLELKKEKMLANLSLVYIANGSWDLRNDSLFTTVKVSDIKGADQITQQVLDASPGMKESLSRVTGEQNISLVKMLSMTKIMCADIRTGLTTTSSRISK